MTEVDPESVRRIVHDATIDAVDGSAQLTETNSGPPEIHLTLESFLASRSTTMPKTPASSSRVPLNAISNMTATGVDMVIQVVLLRYILNFLSIDAFGIWTLIGGLFAYSALLQLGFNSAINYFTPKSLASGDEAAFNRTINTALAYYGSVSIVVLLASSIFWQYFPDWFNVPADLIVKARVLIIMTSVYFACVIPLTVFQGVMSGMQQYLPMNIARTGFRVSRAILIVIFLQLGFGVVGLGVAHLVSRLGEAIAIAVIAVRKAPFLKVSLSMASWLEFKSMAAYSINTLIWSLSSTFRDRLSILIVGAAMAPTAVTRYAVPLIVLQAFYGVMQALAGVTKPAATSLQARDRMDEVRDLVLRGNRLAALVTFSIFFTLVAGGDPLFRIWLGSDSFEGAGLLMTLLLCGEVLVISQLVSAYVLIGVGRQGVFAKMTLSMAVVGAILMIASANLTDWGLNGIALAAMAPSLVLGLIAIPLFTTQEIGCSLRRYMHLSIVRPLCAVLPYGLLLLALVLSLRPLDTVVGLLTNLFIGIPVLLLGIVYIGLDKTERAAIAVATRNVATHLKTGQRS